MNANNDPPQYRRNNTRSDTLTRAFLSTVAAAPGRSQIELLSTQGAPVRWSRGELLRRALRFLAFYRKQGLRRGDVLLVGLPHGETEVPAFLGALLGGVIPSYLPANIQADHGAYRSRLHGLAEQCGAAAVLVDATTRTRASLDAEALGAAILTDEMAAGCAPIDTSELPTLSGDDLALLQHTAGTTGEVKTVAVTHRAVCNQVRHYAQAVATTEHDVIVIPLRLHNPTGLIAGLIQALVTGAELVLVPPEAWVNRPATLLDTITERHGTLCWMPDFAFSLLAHRIPSADLRNCDLSSLRGLVNCSDLCRTRSMWAFAARYQPCGLDPAALGICYAFAENVFAATQTSLKRPPHVERLRYGALLDCHHAVTSGDEDTTIEVLSCGHPIDGTAVRIVDASRRPRPERHIGEIAVRGDSLFAGYHRNDEATAKVLDEWCYTGDIGYLADGELYVLGRQSDRLRVGDRTIYPQPIEAVAASVEGVRTGQVVAIGLPDSDTGGEKVVVLFEPVDEDRPQDPQTEIRRRLSEHAACPVDDVVPVPRQWLMKTAAGRMARSTNRDRYLAMLKSAGADRFFETEKALRSAAKSKAKGLRMLPRAVGDGQSEGEPQREPQHAASADGGPIPSRRPQPV